MIALETLCPDCEADLSPGRARAGGLSVRGCPSCGAAWPTAQETQDLWSLARLERQLTALVECRVACRWVPGTLDRVQLVREATDERAEVSLAWVRQQVGHRAVDDLYLKGRTFFGCDLEFWRAVRAA